MTLRSTLVVLLGVFLMGLLMAALLMAPEPSIALNALVAEQLENSGTGHPITAVLLNFRSYDTLLEVAVLLVAVMITLQMKQHPYSNPEQTPEPVAYALITALVPIITLMAFYLLWAGSYQPGGAFQAGALLAAAGVAARLAGIPIHERANLVLTLGLVMGLTVFLIVAIAALFFGNAFLAYPEGTAGAFILLIEFVLTLSIGLTLLSLFLFSPKEPNHGH